jgi:DNA mismatch endonuclease (patch repair protein)
MKGNRKRDTRPEVALRSALHRQGNRFRCDYPIRIQGYRLVRVDIAFPKRRVAVFVDGCFWHRCPDHGTSPRANHGYWSAKLARNAERDGEVDAALTGCGWAVVRVWEHEAPEVAARRICEVLDRLTAPG